MTRKTGNFFYQLSRISTVGPNSFDPSETTNQNTAQEITCTIPILNRRFGDGYAQQETVSVYQHVSFPSDHLFARIIATYSGLASCSNALTVEDRSGRGFFFPHSVRAKSLSASWTCCQIPSFVHRLK